jgi:hypothetical protein
VRRRRLRASDASTYIKDLHWCSLRGRRDRHLRASGDAGGELPRRAILDQSRPGPFRQAELASVDISCCKLISAVVTAALLLSVLSACGDSAPRPVRFGTYVSQLCEAVGPFAGDAQRLGRVLARVGVHEKSRKSEQALSNFLTAAIVDAHSVVTKLKASGTPEVRDGRVLAAEVAVTFGQIEKSDAMWLTELRTLHRVWPIASRVRAERLRTSLRALVLVQFERLPRTPERQNAMARSPVCQHVFGSVRVGG